MSVYNAVWNKLIYLLNASVLGRLIFRLTAFIKSLYEQSGFYRWLNIRDSSSVLSSSKIFPFIAKTLFGEKTTAYVKDGLIIRAVLILPSVWFSLPTAYFAGYCLGAAAVFAVAAFYGRAALFVPLIFLLSSIILWLIKGDLASVADGSLFLKWFIGWFELKFKALSIKTTLLGNLLAFALAAMCACSVFFLPLKLAVALIVGIAVFPLALCSPFLLVIAAIAVGLFLPTLLACMVSVVAFFLTLVHMYAGRLYFPRLRGAYAFAIIYLLIMLYYTLFGYGGILGIQSGGIQLSMFLMFFTASAVFNSKERIVKLFKAMVFLGAGSGIIGISQFFGGFGGTNWANKDPMGNVIRRIFGTFNNPNVFGEFLLLVIPMAIALLLITKKRYKKFVYGALAALLIVNLGLTYSRGCYFAVIIVFLLMIWHIDKRLISLVFVLLPLLLLILPSGIIARFASIGNLSGDGSITYRYEIWEACLRLLRQVWFLGIGIGSHTFNLFYQYFMHADRQAQHSHNFVIQLIIELSIVGFAVFLMIFIYSVRDAKFKLVNTKDRVLRLTIMTLCAAIIGIMVSSVLDYVFYDNIIFMLIWILLGAVNAGVGIKSAQQPLAYKKREDVKNA